MTSKIPSKHANIGMPRRASMHETKERQTVDDNREYAPREQALEFAAALAARNTELMRRLA